MENWKQDVITNIQTDPKLNDKIKERMIKLVKKSQHTDYSSFQWDPEIWKKMYNIHINYRHYDRDRKHYVESRMMEAVVDSYKKVKPVEIINYKLE